ncbi:MAG: hypothetical protein EA402_08360 [Planctomycetota bacterium]|nr:MAG: hypothetical protein EA402_08360 [Planctomycetota bacterium]
MGIRSPDTRDFPLIAPGSWLEPGDQDPHADAAAADLAEIYAVPVQALRDWQSAGLPATAEGRFNPFTVCNWLSQGRLQHSPALRRRWRMYLDWFRPHVEGIEERRRVVYARSHACYLPAAAAELCWWLPRLTGTEPGQEVLSDTLPAAAWRVGGVEWWRWQLSEPGPGAHRIRGRAEVILQSRQLQDRDGAEVEDLRETCRRLMAEISYGYRRHRRRDDGALACSVNPASCLDLACLLLARLRQAGRQGVLVGGIIPHNHLANPHFWIEVASQRGPLPIDISLPTIAAMLGEDPEPWLRAYVGGCDARRISLGRGCPQLPMLAGRTFTRAIGEALVRTAEGQWYNAWPCIDWVCGECEAHFEHRVLDF